MIKSMTGYGQGECLSHDRRFKVEIKSVNHRYGDIVIKLPRFLNVFEDRIRKRLARDILRGKTDVFIQFETFSARDMRVTINTAFADAYAAALNELTTRYGLTGPPSLADMTAQPDVFSIDRNSPDDTALNELWETLSAALEEAAARFNAMREAEGRALFHDLTAKRENIMGLLERIRERAPSVEAEHAARFRERIADTLAAVSIRPEEIDEARLLTEIAVFADRSCIDEELTRLASHLAQMGEILSQPEAVGRKLDFLVQEINREANTIGSKSNDAALTRLVVDLKSEVEKIREQVQNIE